MKKCLRKAVIHGNVKLVAELEDDGTYTVYFESTSKTFRMHGVMPLRGFDTVDNAFKAGKKFVDDNPEKCLPKTAGHPPEFWPK